MRRFVKFQTIATFLAGPSLVLALGCSSAPGDDPRQDEPQAGDTVPVPTSENPPESTNPGSPGAVDPVSPGGDEPAMDPMPKPAGSSASAVNGESCALDSECASGHCVDGVCCDTACSGACESCDSAGLEGTCSPHAYGTDPESECGTPACYSGMQERFFCNGASACDVEIIECGLYVCGGHSCYTECRTDDECVATAWCNAGRCEEK